MDDYKKEVAVAGEWSRKTRKAENRAMRSTHKAKLNKEARAESDFFDDNEPRINLMCQDCGGPGAYETMDVEEAKCNDNCGGDDKCYCQNYTPVQVCLECHRKRYANEVEF